MIHRSKGDSDFSEVMDGIPVARYRGSLQVVTSSVFVDGIIVGK